MAIRIDVRLQPELPLEGGLAWTSIACVRIMGPMRTPNSSAQSFGEFIREARRSRGWTGEELADRAGVRKGYVSGIENGKVRPPKDWLVIVLAKQLKLDAVDLLIRAYVAKAPAIIREELARRCLSTKPRKSP